MTISLQEALQRTIEHREIFHDEMLSMMRQIMSGEVTPVMIAALTVGLRVKKETIGEIAAAAQVMREFATKVDVPDHEQPGRHRRHRRRRVAHVQHLDRVDVRRGGGRRARRQARRSLGVVEVRQRRRARGARRQHHADAGRRSRTRSPRPASASCSRRTTISAMKHAAPVRKELGVRTIFNILGPLTNPAGAPNQLLGVFHPDLVGIQVRVLQRLGSKHVLVVYGKDGMDEISLGAATMVGELKDGEVREYEIHPEDFGLAMVVESRPQGRRRGGIEGDGAGGARRHRGHAARDRHAERRRRALRRRRRGVDRRGHRAARARRSRRGAARRKLDQFVALTQKLGATPG